MTPLLIKIAVDQNTDEIITNLLKTYKIKSTNLFKIIPQKYEITISQIRQLQQQLIIKTIEPSAYVFYFFDRSSIEVQNSLLKTLEEKVEQNLFCFFVLNLEKVIPTIKSRSKIVLYNKTMPTTFSQDVLNLIRLIKTTKKPDFIFDKKFLMIDKETFANLNLELMSYFRNQLRSSSTKETIIKILKRILEINQLVENNNLNPQLAFDNLLIFIWKCLK